MILPSFTHEPTGVGVSFIIPRGLGCSQPPLTSTLTFNPTVSPVSTAPVPVVRVPPVACAIRLYTFASYARAYVR
jgi:hypothetical protein